MPSDVFMFWFIHLALGVLVPILALSGCCRREEEQRLKEKEAALKRNAS
jgi:hypothetical protein